MASATASSRTSHGSSNGHHSSVPVESRRSASGTHPLLATPTDLKPEETKKVADTVNPLVADHFALYVKYKNFHWHLASSNFRSYHLMFDEHAEDVFNAIDIMAERIRKVGGTTIRSIGHIARLTEIEDDDEEFVAAPEMIRRLLEDNKASAKKLREAIETTEEARDTPTSNLLQDILDRTERRIWFLFEISTGGEHEN